MDESILRAQQETAKASLDLFDLRISNKSLME
jgi:hypothetical protein